MQLIISLRSWQVIRKIRMDKWCFQRLDPTRCKMSLQPWEQIPRIRNKKLDIPGPCKL